MAKLNRKEFRALKELIAEYYTNKKIIIELRKENAELKEMIKNAMIDINSLCFCGSENCDYCKYDNNIEECNNSDGFYWVHKDQALKLIGGKNDDK